MLKISLVYLALVSLIAVAFTVYDKYASGKGKWRVSEEKLLCISAVGGSFAMLLTMIIIRHKTKHIKFMAGIPLIIFLQFMFSVFLSVFIAKNKGILL